MSTPQQKDLLFRELPTRLKHEASIITHIDEDGNQSVLKNKGLADGIDYVTVTIPRHKMDALKGE